MKTFEQLTKEEQEKARNHAKEKLVDNLVRGILYFDEGSAKGKQMNQVVRECLNVAKERPEFSPHTMVADNLKEDLEPYVDSTSRSIVFLEAAEYGVYLDSL